MLILILNHALKVIFNLGETVSDVSDLTICLSFKNSKLLVATIIQTHSYMKKKIRQNQAFVKHILFPNSALKVIF